jgi:hypothetical protein
MRVMVGQGQGWGARTQRGPVVDFLVSSASRR